MSSIKSTATRSIGRHLKSKNLRVFTTTERNVGIAATTRFRPSKPATSTLDFPQSRIAPNIIPSAISTPAPHTQNSFDTLISSLTSALTTNPSPSLPALHNLLRTYASNSIHWSKYAHANPAKQYTRNLVFEVPGVFNLLLLVWTPGKESPVHDHADSHCLMKLGLHEISNPSPTDYAVSLHLYTPPNAALRGCHIYDIHNGEAKHVMQCPYDSVKGNVPSAQ
ncbi:hypothetical protein G7Y89_g4200 [Cudoniella acicularis]|uniref:Cysteine dioxygenase n=1 Tax=Cudoniella acicularis TaxID=354080 RepID=A0A8H4W4I3_9HELO|nr:hypothetical protein G7Y89_g4200 [Cudoniella acicularis]